MDDITLVERMLDRVAATPREAAAAKRLLGVQAAADRASLEWAPAPPPPPPLPLGQIDHVAHTLAAIAKYEQWVASYPDDDPTPLPRRRRALLLAYQSLQELQSGDGA